MGRIASFICKQQNFLNNLSADYLCIYGFQEKERRGDRERESKEKEKKTANGHLFIPVSQSPSTACQHCTKLLHNKETFLCNSKTHSDLLFFTPQLCPSFWIYFYFLSLFPSETCAFMSLLTFPSFLYISLTSSCFLPFFIYSFPWAVSVSLSLNKAHRLIIDFTWFIFKAEPHSLGRTIGPSEPPVVICNSMVMVNVFAVLKAKTDLMLCLCYCH